MKIGLLKFFICFNVRFKFTSKIYLLKLFSEDLADSNFFIALIYVFRHKGFHKLPRALKPLGEFLFRAHVLLKFYTKIKIELFVSMEIAIHNSYDFNFSLIR